MLPRRRAGWRGPFPFQGAPVEWKQEDGVKGEENPDWKLDGGPEEWPGRGTDLNSFVVEATELVVGNDPGNGALLELEYEGLEPVASVGTHLIDRAPGELHAAAHDSQGCLAILVHDLVAHDRLPKEGMTPQAKEADRTDHPDEEDEAGAGRGKGRVFRNQWSDLSLTAV